METMSRAIADGQRMDSRKETLVETDGLHSMAKRKSWQIGQRKPESIISHCLEDF
jgi:hypothetical protein